MSPLWMLSLVSALHIVQILVPKAPIPGNAITRTHEVTQIYFGGGLRQRWTNFPRGLGKPGKDLPSDGPNTQSLRQYCLHSPSLALFASPAKATCAMSVREIGPGAGAENTCPSLDIMRFPLATPTILVHVLETPVTTESYLWGLEYFSYLPYQDL